MDFGQLWDDFMGVVKEFWDFVVASEMEQLVMALGGLLVLMVLVAIMLRQRRKKAGGRSQKKLLSREVEEGGKKIDLATYQDVTYMPLPILTATEIRFWGLLYQAAPGCYIFPQVAVSAILTIQSESYDHFWEVMKKYQSARIDFVVCDQQLNILALVELDDQVNDQRRAKDAEIDYITRQAGYKTVRFDRNKQWPNPEQIRASIF